MGALSSETEGVSGKKQLHHFLQQSARNMNWRAGTGLFSGDKWQDLREQLDAVSRDI